MEESKRLLGEVIPLDHLPTTKSRLALTKRFPIGPILAISPFTTLRPLLAPIKIGKARSGKQSIIQCEFATLRFRFTPTRYQ